MSQRKERLMKKDIEQLPELPDDGVKELTPSSEDVVKNDEENGSELKTEEPTQKIKRPSLIHKDDVKKSFDEIHEIITNEIIGLRNGTIKSRGVRTMMMIASRLKKLDPKCVKAAIMAEKYQDLKNANKLPRNKGKPSVILSQELLEFCQWSAEDRHTRGDVIKFITQYIKNNNLENPENYRYIDYTKDESLTRLLGLTDRSVVLTYPLIPRYLSQHITPESEPSTE